MNGFEKWYSGLAKWIKCVLALFGCGIVARIFKFIETKDNSPLIGAILEVIPVIGQVIAIIDLVTNITDDNFKILYAAGSLNDFKAKEEKKDDTIDAEVEDKKAE